MAFIFGYLHLISTLVEIRDVENEKEERKCWNWYASHHT